MVDLHLRSFLLLLAVFWRVFTPQKVEFGQSFIESTRFSLVCRPNSNHLQRQIPSPQLFHHLTDPFRQSVKWFMGKGTPPDGSDLTWATHYRFAYEDKMRCDNWSLVYFSSHFVTLSAQLRLKAETLSGRDHPKPFLMHHHFKVTEMTVQEALWSKIIPYFCLHKWFIKG